MDKPRTKTNPALEGRGSGRVMATLALCLLLTLSPLLHAMPVPSEGTEPAAAAHGSGVEPTAVQTSVKYLVITLFVAMTVTGVVYLADDDKDNDNTGYLLLLPLISQGIFWLALDED